MESACCTTIGFWVRSWPDSCSTRVNSSANDFWLANDTRGTSMPASAIAKMPWRPDPVAGSTEAAGAAGPIALGAA
eukprot:6227167-Alexandrium_andersonii.AAC.1